MSNDWKEIFLNDINFYFRIKNASTVSVDFEAYETTVYDNGEGSEHKFRYFTNEGHEEFTHDVSKCEPYVTGFIKWDGCSEVNFAPNIHSCGGRESLTRLGVLFEKIFKEASSMMDSCEGYL